MDVLDACARLQAHTRSQHMRKRSSSGEEVRESPVFVYQWQVGGGGGGWWWWCGGVNLIPHSAQLKHALMPLVLLLQDFLSPCFLFTLCSRMCACVRVFVHACISVEL